MNRRRGYTEMESAPPAPEPTTGHREEALVDEEARAAAPLPLAMLVARQKKASQGKQRIEICYIPNKEKRQVTFSKRRQGLFKKSSELVQLCGAHVAVIVFSERSKPFAMGSPSVDAVLREYVPTVGGGADEEEDDEVASWLLPDVDEEEAAACRDAVEAALRQAEETKAQVVAERARMEAIGRKVREAMGDKKHWFEADVEKLGREELPEFARALQKLRENLQRQVDRLSPAAGPPTPGQ